MKVLSRFAAFILFCFSVGTAFAFVVEVDADVDGALRPVVKGVTNLPDGAELMVRISNDELGYSGQDKVKVEGGVFETVSFTNKGNDFVPGEYELSVSMSVPAFQDGGVREVVGEKGENMSGPLVEDAGLMDSNMVSYSRRITIGE